MTIGAFFRGAPAVVAWVISCAILAHADAQNLRKPFGVYAKIDIQDAIAGYTSVVAPTPAQLHSYLRSLYTSLLANPAISGISVGAHWDDIQLTNATDSSAYDWSYLDDAFSVAYSANKSVQLNLTAGFDAPQWFLSQISSCDPLFTKGTAPADCGKVTFEGFPQQQRADGKVMPLPWNTVYQQAWASFLAQLNARYGSNPLFVSIAIGGPVGASTELIFPTSVNTTAPQPSGLTPDATWAALIQHSFPSNSSYQNSDQVFIDAWKQAIGTYESIFSGITLFISPDAGNDFPTFSATVTPHSDNTLFTKDCSNAIQGAMPDLMSCEAKTEILSYFVAAAGPNAKSTQVGGMTASSPAGLGNIGIAGVKLLTSLSPPPSPPILGGAEFDHPVFGGNLQVEGCPTPNAGCPSLTPEEGAYNVLTNFFTGTQAAAFYNGPPGPATMQYLAVPYTDVQYAEANPCPAAQSSIIGKTSLQDLYNHASYDLFAIAGQTTTLPPLTCSAPTINLVANAEAEAPVIAPNTWVEIKGFNLAPSGDSRIWQTSDFTGAQMPTQLDKISVTVNNKSAYVYYISPNQVNVLTPPDSISGTVSVVVSNNGTASAAFSAQAQPLSPSFFVFSGGPYVAAQHADYSLLGPASLSAPGYTFTPAKPGEAVLLYANGFGPTNVPVSPGSQIQSGTLSTLPEIAIGGVKAQVQYAGLVYPGQFQFNVVIPSTLSNGDQTITATYNGATTQTGALIAVHK